MRFTNVRFSGQILPALKKKNWSRDGLQLRPSAAAICNAFFRS
jgi:hypothetical protein